MKEEKNLDVMLGTMQPELREGEWVFCTIADGVKMNENPLLIFQEKEGMTIIVRKAVTEKHGLRYDGV